VSCHRNKRYICYFADRALRLGRQVSPRLGLSGAGISREMQNEIPTAFSLDSSLKNSIMVPRMVEVLVIFGLLTWLFLTFLEWLSTLPVFPAVVTAAVLCPILSARGYSRLIRTWKLCGIYSNRDPIPPERFYWIAQRIRLQRSIVLFSIPCVLAWFNAAILPASLDVNLVSIVGWLNSLVGMLLLSRVVCATTLFFKASQWFDAMSPTLVGLLRLAMYKLSDNYEYLGQKKRDPAKEKVY
jgi:hypothetical protein